MSETEPTVGARPRRRVDRTEIVIAQHVTGRLRDHLWDLYRAAFASVQPLAISVQKLERDTFDVLVDHEGTYKVLGFVDGEPKGLIVLTDRIDLVPGVSASALAHRYPDAWQRHAVFYVPFALVAEGTRDLSLYSALIAAAAQLAAVRDGVIVVDMCRHLVHSGQVKAIERAVRRFDGAAFEEVDAQVFYALSLPHPAAKQTGTIAMSDVVVDFPTKDESSPRSVEVSGPAGA